MTSTTTTTTTTPDGSSSSSRRRRSRGWWKAAIFIIGASLSGEDKGKEKGEGEGEGKGGGGWKAAIFIILVEAAERFSFFGIAGNLMMYLTSVLGYEMADAAKSVNLWQGVAMICPLLGAFVADSVLGRFTTVLVSSSIYLFGLVLLLVSASVAPLRPNRALFFLALYTLAIGEGGHKPSVQTFAADQFPEETDEEKAAKSSFFNWWYFGIAVGASAGIGAVIVAQRSAGWAVGFGVPAGAMALGLAVFVAGIRFYERDNRDVVAGRSPYTKVAQVVVAAVRKRRVREQMGIFEFEDNINININTNINIAVENKIRTKGTTTLARTNQFRCLDKAMVIDEVDVQAEHRNPWRLCSLTQVEEVKLVLRLIPIWLTCLPFSIVYAQLFTFFTKQANSLSFPAAARLHLLPSYLPLFLSILFTVVLVIFYDRAVVPFLRTITGKPTGITILQRIGIGQFLCLVIMSMAALVETRRVSIASAHGLLDAPKATVPMTVWWVVPQYMVLSVAEVFVVVGMQQLFYDQMPDGLRSLGAAAYISAIGLGSFVSSGIIELVQGASGRRWLVDNINRAHLDYFFWLLAGLSGAVFLVYLWISSRFVYKTYAST